MKDDMKKQKGSRKQVPNPSIMYIGSIPIHKPMLAAGIAFYAAVALQIFVVCMDETCTLQRIIENRPLIVSALGKGLLFGIGMYFIVNLITREEIT